VPELAQVPASEQVRVLEPVPVRALEQALEPVPGPLSSPSPLESLREPVLLARPVPMGLAALPTRPVSQP